MVRREGTRSSTSRDAMIKPLSGSPGRKVTGRIRNVSLSGLYLEMPNADLSDYARLRMILGPEGEGAGQSRIWLDCFVVHVTDTGVGAMFEKPDPYEIGGLLELLRECPGGHAARPDPATSRTGARDHR